MFNIFYFSYIYNLVWRLIVLLMKGPEMNSLEMNSPEMNNLEMNSPEMNSLEMNSPHIPFHID